MFFTALRHDYIILKMRWIFAALFTPEARPVLPRSLSKMMYGWHGSVSFVFTHYSCRGSYLTLKTLAPSPSRCQIKPGSRSNLSQPRFGQMWRSYQKKKNDRGLGAWYSTLIKPSLKAYPWVILDGQIGVKSTNPKHKPGSCSHQRAGRKRNCRGWSQTEVSLDPGATTAPTGYWKMAHLRSRQL